MASALDQLKKAANLQPVKKVVALSDGSEFVFWRSPLTMAERERAQKGSNDDTNAFALQLLSELDYLPSRVSRRMRTASGFFN